MEVRIPFPPGFDEYTSVWKIKVSQTQVIPIIPPLLKVKTTSPPATPSSLYKSNLIGGELPLVFDRWGMTSCI